MKKIISSLILSTFLYSPLIHAGQTFSNFYFFGDSLSDVGNNGVYSNGALWTQLLGERYGKNIQASNSGGTDSATSNSRTYDGNDPENPGHPLPPGINTQVQNRLNSGPIDNRALYTVWTGSNDMKRLDEEGHGAILNIVHDGVTNTAAAVQRLHNAGARYIMVINLPDAGQTPDFYPNPDLSNAINIYNSSLTQTMSKIGFKVIQIDVNSTFNAVMANPGRYGFTDVHHKCSTTAGCDYSTFLFYDGRHPTSAGHRLIFDAIMGDFQGAANAAVLADAPLTTLSNTNTAISNELLALRNGGQSLTEGQYRGFVTSLYAPSLVDTQSNWLAGYRQHDLGVIAGIEYRWTRDLILGTAISRSTSRVDFSGPGGSFDMDDDLWSVFASFKQDKYYINGITNIGLVHFRNIHRNIPLYMANDVATAKTIATHFGGQLEAGYNLFNDRIKSGPFVTASYQYLDVEPFAEEGATPGRNLQFYRMINDSLVTALGWQVTYPQLWNNRRITPFAQASVNKEWLRKKNVNNGIREIDISEVSLSANLGAIPVGEVNNNPWLFTNLGVNAQLNRYLSGSLTLQANLFKKPYHSYTVMASLQMPL